MGSPGRALWVFVVLLYLVFGELTAHRGWGWYLILGEKKSPSQVKKNGVGVFAKSEERYSGEN